jgi:predicted house-cleaning NTP pyrophosphatase (Maf/HAM1 superfamily)
MSKKKMRRTEMYITNNQYKQVKKEADKREITFSEMTRKIIDHYLEREK